MQYRTGCAVWGHRPWLDNFYPPTADPSDLLSLYAQRMTAVEGNTTFYSPPSVEVVARWRDQTPESFEFCLKLPRTISHYGLLAPKIDQAQRFIERTALLGPRLGPYFGVLSPSYGPERLRDLAAFLAAWPKTQRLALEVRNGGWFHSPHRERLNDLLQQHAVARVLLDTRPVFTGIGPDPQATCERKKPQVPLDLVLTAPFTMVRLISHPKASFNTRWLTSWVPTVQSWLAQGTQVYFFVHCPIEDTSPTTCREFYHRLLAAGTPLPQLPWDHIPEPARQLALI